MPDHVELLTTAGAATLMVLLRCVPVLLPTYLVTRYSQELSRASRLAIGLALLLALYRLLRLDSSSIVAGSVFAGGGLVIFVAYRSLAAALIGAAIIYAGMRLVL